MDNKKRGRFCLLMIIVTLHYSCRHSNQKIQSSIYPTVHSQPETDTSLWLKETRGIRDILEDSKGNIWFASPDYIAMYDGKTLNYFTENDGLNIVGNIHEDQNRTIWIENGFDIYRYNGGSFTAGKLSCDPVSDTSQKSQNRIWMQRGLNPSDTSYAEPGIYIFNQTETEFFPFPVARTDNNKYLYFPTTKASFGKDGAVWFGTMEKVFGFQNDSFISIGREEMGRQNDPRQMGIRGIFVDSKGKLWIADNGAGIFVFDGKGVEHFTGKHHLDEGDTEGNTLHRAFSIAEDTLGNMWFGTVYSGIWKYSPNTKEFENYSEKDGVLSDNIWTIHRTRKDELLFAGETPGAVYKFNGKTFDRIF